MMNAEIINLKLDEECPKCCGTSAWMENKPCDRCNSTGRIPTSLGDDLLEFLARHGIKSDKQEN